VEGLREKLRGVEREVEERDGKVDELEQKLFELSGNFPLLFFPVFFFLIMGFSFSFSFTR
jgi:pilus assembly protein TadC